MKLHTALLTIVLIAGCSQAPSDAVDTRAAAAKDAKMPATQPASVAGEGSAMPADAATTKASVNGTVEAVDAGAGKITISHGAVESLKWPAMTMGFKAMPEQVASVQVGQEVQFEFEFRGMDATITQITPVK